MVSQINMGSTKQVVMLPFFADNVVDGSFTLNAYPPGTAWVAAKEYVMPFKGSVIGFSGALSEALTDGTLQAFPTIDGVASSTWTSANLTIETPQYKYLAQQGRKSGYSFAAGARIGMGLHKDINGGTVAPTTADGVFTLVILLEGIDY